MNKYCNVILKQHYSVILTKNNDYFLAKYKTKKCFYQDGSDAQTNKAQESQGGLTCLKMNLTGEYLLKPHIPIRHFTRHLPPTSTEQPPPV